jgi:HSP20 family protein
MAQQEKETQQQETSRRDDQADQGQRQPQEMATTSPQQGQQGSLARTDPTRAVLTANPFAIMRRLTEEMDRVFEGFLSFGRSRFGFPSLPELASHGMGELSRAAWSPPVEMFQRDGQLVVRADLPGLKKEDIKVEVINDILIVRGERKQEQEEKREGFYRSERSYGTFQRAIPLPEGVNTENVTARFQDGVLEITMPAPQRVQQESRQIPVQ